MSSKKYAAPLQLEIGSSRLLLIFLFFLHAFSLVLLFFLSFSLSFPLWLSIFCVILILISGVYTIKYHAIKILPSSIVGLIWDVNDDWFVLRKDGEKNEVTLDGNSLVHPWFAILNFRQEDKFFPRSIILLSDNMNENDFRRLRVRLKVTNLHESLSRVE